MFFLKYLFLLACVLLISCTSDSNDSIVSQVIDDQSNSINEYSLYLTGNDASASNQSRLLYRLYGYDPLIADLSATLVFERSIVLGSLPSLVSLEWPLDAESFIRPPVANADSAVFYIKLYVDLDMDGQICNGDLAQDYSQTEYFTLISKPEATLDFHLKTIDNEDCVSY